jgi:hypothetical protein
MRALCFSAVSIMSATKNGNVTELEHVQCASGLWDGEATLSQCAATHPPQPNTILKFLS